MSRLVLSTAQVVEIRRAWRDRVERGWGWKTAWCEETAERYGVSLWVIIGVVDRRTYQDVIDPEEEWAAVEALWQPVRDGHDRELRRLRKAKFEEDRST